MTTQPLVLTAGEPAGIGPDLCIALAAASGLPAFVVIGDATAMQCRADMLKADVQIRVVDRVAAHEQSRSPNELFVIDLPFPAAVECGEPDESNAQTLLDGLALGVEGCRDGRFSALVTAPLSKHVISGAGIPFTGHTEFLADLTDTPLPVMLLVAGDMRVALATTHLALRDVPDRISEDSLYDVLSVLHNGLQQQFGIEAPEIIVCGLNPHAGEGGQFGHEDEAIIAPVVNAAIRNGMKVRGPVPADTAFTPAAGTRDVVLAMYHDQGLPVLKYAGFGHAVNVTLGLPIVRTSVDHGTAFDLAGTGQADAGSLKAALELAAALSSRA